MKVYEITMGQDRRQRRLLTMKKQECQTFDKRIAETSENANQGVQISSKVFIKSFWTMMCCVGFLFHFYDSTRRYMNFEATSQVSIAINNKLTPPAISVCFDIRELILIDRFDVEQREDYHKYGCSQYTSGGANKTACEKFLRRMTITEIFSNKSITSQNFFTQTVDKRIFNEVELDYFSFTLKCFKQSRFKDRYRKLSSGEMDRMMNPSRKVLDSRFNRSATGTGFKLTMAVNLHENHKLRHFREGNMLTLSTNPKEQNLFYLDFEETESTFLKYPYASACRTYEGTIFESKAHCFELCYGGPQGKSNGQDGFITTQNYDILNYSMRNEHTIDLELDDKCNEICHTDCITKQYFASITEKFKFEILEPTFIIRVYSSHPSVAIVMMASFGLDSYVVFSASILGLWFGCSIFLTVTDIISSAHAILRKINDQSSNDPNI